jgi:hypothetical protein
MKVSKRVEHVVRETVLKMLSSEEIARVSTAEAGSRLIEGEEYLDLEHLDQGVPRAPAATKAAMGQVLPRAAIRPDTWDKILARLAGRACSGQPVEQSLP